MSFGAGMQQVAGQLIGLFGSGRTATVRLYTLTKDNETGMQTTTVSEEITGVPVVVEVLRPDEFEGQEQTDRRVYLDGKGIGTVNLLSASRVTVEIDGERERSMVPPIENVNPDGSSVLWQGILREGAGDAR